MMYKKFINRTLIFLFLQYSSLAANEGWIFRKSMPTARTGINAVVLDGKIYVIGGQDGNGNVLNLVERYDPVTDTWDTEIPHLRQDRVNASAVVFNEKIFVLGGRNGEREVLKKVEFFDPSKNEWESFPKLNEKRQGLAAVVLNGTMYVVGGSDNDDDILDDVEYFDAKDQKWKKFDEWRLDFPRASLVTLAIKDSAFSIGGFSILGPLPFVQRYHQNAGTAKRRGMLTPRGALAATARNDTIYVMGGRGQNNKVVNSMEFFIPRLNKWVQSLPLQIARENFAAVTVNNKIYAIGGDDENGNVLSSIEELELVTAISKKEPIAPLDFGLQQNYPNPFNPSTKITFRVSSQNNSSSIKLYVYNLQGQLITTLVNDKLIPGEYEVFWNGHDREGLPVASGIYIYTLQQGQYKDSKKMMLIR